MAVDYYLKVKEHPANSPGIHIGRSEQGWCFGLHLYPQRNIHDLDDWLELFTRPDTVIVAGNGGEISPDRMYAIITQRDNFLPKLQRSLVRHSINRNCIGYGDGPFDLMLGGFF